MPKYQTRTVRTSFLSTLDGEIAAETRRQGNDGWRVESINRSGTESADIQFVKD